MPRRIPSYRCYKPKNLGLFIIDGKQHYLGAYGTPESLAEYNRLIQEHLARGGAPSPSPGGGLTVSELIVAFWQHAEHHYRSPEGKPTGELENFRDALRPVRQLYGRARHRASAHRPSAPSGSKWSRPAFAGRRSTPGSTASAASLLRFRKVASIMPRDVEAQQTDH